MIACESPAICNPVDRVASSRNYPLFVVSGFFFWGLARATSEESGATSNCRRVPRLYSECGLGTVDTTQIELKRSEPSVQSCRIRSNLV